MISFIRYIYTSFDGYFCANFIFLYFFFDLKIENNCNLIVCIRHILIIYLVRITSLLMCVHTKNNILTKI